MFDFIKFINLHVFVFSYTPRFPNPGESVVGTSFLAGPGGKGANQAVAAAKLGAEVEIIAKVRT